MPTSTTTNPSIDNRRLLQARKADAVIEAAAALAAVAVPVFTAAGAVAEVHLYRGGELRASIFKPATGRLGIWRSACDQVTANTPEEAVRCALDPLRKRTRKPAKAQ